MDMYCICTVHTYITQFFFEKLFQFFYNYNTLIFFSHGRKDVQQVNRANVLSISGLLFFFSIKVVYKKKIKMRR